MRGGTVYIGQKGYGKMKKRIIATLSAVLAVILLLFTSAFASSATDDGLKNVDGKCIHELASEEWLNNYMQTRMAPLSE